MKLWQKIRCALSMHSRLDVIQTFGAAQHIGCPHCKREFGIHHGMEAIIPWDSKIADMYQMLGYDTETPSRRWREYVRRMGATP